MKTIVTLELNNYAENGIIEKAIVLTWSEVILPISRKETLEWVYECKGWEGDCLQVSIGGTAPIDMDIKEILKEIVCEKIDEMERDEK